MKRKINISVPQILGRNQYGTIESSYNDGRSNPSAKSSNQPKYRIDSALNSNTENAAHLRRRIQKGQRFQTLFSMVKRQKKVSDHISESSNYVLSKKCTPQNTRRVIDGDGLHHSLEKAKENNDCQQKILKRTYSAPKKPRSSHCQSIKPANSCAIRENSSNEKLQNSSNNNSRSSSETIASFSQNYSLTLKDPFSRQFDRILTTLDHDSHAHIRQTECFLSERELEYVLIQMHYIKANYIKNTENQSKYCRKMFCDLGGNTYGGVVCENVQNFLRIVDGCKSLGKETFSEMGETHNHFINENLKLKASQKQRKTIYSQYFPLRTSRILWLSKKVGKDQQKLTLKNQNKIQYKNLTPISSNSGKENARGFLKVQARKNPTKENLKIKEPQPEICRKDLRNSKENIVVQDPQSPIPNKSPTSRADGSDNLQLPNSLQEERVTSQEIPETEQTKQNPNTLQASSQQATNNSFFTKGNYENPLVNKKKPILSVDVNLGDGITEKIIVYQGESASQVANRLSERFKIDEQMKLKFEKMLESHIRTLLWKIQEVSQELISDRQ